MQAYIKSALSDQITDMRLPARKSRTGIIYSEKGGNVERLQSRTGIRWFVP